MELKTKSSFKNAGYAFAGILLLALLGFWPSYFSHFFNDSANFNFYFHFHAAVVCLWMIALVAQPMLMKAKRFALHKTIGKFSYVLFPLLIVSVILLTHHRHLATEKDLDMSIFIPFKDLLILTTGYGIAIFNLTNTQIHARGMVVTGIAFIEPPMIRLISNANVSFPNSYYLTMACVLLLLLLLIYLERKHLEGKWIFPFTMGLYIVSYFIILFHVQLPHWNAFVNWFIRLPLT